MDCDNLVSITNTCVIYGNINSLKNIVFNCSNDVKINNYKLKHVIYYLSKTNKCKSLEITSLSDVKKT
jgi:hypothetical protein